MSLVNTHLTIEQAFKSKEENLSLIEFLESVFNKETRNKFKKEFFNEDESIAVFGFNADGYSIVFTLKLLNPYSSFPLVSVSCVSKQYTSFELMGQSRFKEDNFKVKFHRQESTEFDLSDCFDWFSESCRKLVGLSIDSISPYHNSKELIILSGLMR